MTEFWQENLTLAPADITSLRMPEVFVNHKNCFLNLQYNFSQFLLSSCQDFVHNYPCSSLLCMRPWEFSKYLAKEIQISTLLRKDKQQELNSDSSKQFPVQLLSKQWSCCFCWQLKQSKKQSHLSRQRAVVSLLVVSHHFLLLSWNHPLKKKKKQSPTAWQQQGAGFLCKLRNSGAELLATTICFCETCIVFWEANHFSFPYHFKVIGLFLPSGLVF